MMETETAAKVAAEALNGTTYVRPSPRLKQKPQVTDDVAACSINSYHVDIHVREMKQLSVVVTASGHERQRKPCHGGLGGWVRDKLEDCLLLGPGWMKIG